MPKKSLLKNYLVLAILLFVIAYVLALVIGLIFDYLNVGDFGFGTVTTAASAIILGEIYSRKFKEIMPKDLRLKVALIYAGISLIVFLIPSYQIGLLSTENVKDPVFYAFLFSLLLGIVVSLLVVYWLLWLGGKFHIEKIEKKQKKAK